MEMTTPAQPELKPCPFCGGDPFVSHFTWHSKHGGPPTRRGVEIRCDSLGFDDDLPCVLSEGPGAIYETEHDAAEAWNRRATEPAEPKGYDPLRTAKMLRIAADALDLLQGVLQKGALTEDDEGAIWELDQDMGDAIIRGASDLDRAWAWFRENSASLGRNAALEVWECWIVGECYGSGPTKSAAVLDAWRAAMGKEEDQ